MADKEDIITQTLDKDVVGMQNTFAELMLDKIRDAVAERKAQVAQEFMGVNPDDTDDEEYEDETEDDEDFEDEDGTIKAQVMRKDRTKVFEQNEINKIKKSLLYFKYLTKLLIIKVRLIMIKFMD